MSRIPPQPMTLHRQRPDAGTEPCPLEARAVAPVLRQLRHQCRLPPPRPLRARRALLRPSLVRLQHRLSAPLCPSVWPFLILQLVLHILPEIRRCVTSNDVENRLTGELAIDEPASDRADLIPWLFDRDLRSQLFRGDEIGEQREADAGPLDAHQFVKQGEPIEPHTAGRKEVTALEMHLSGV